jgi:hypothetical protein
VGAKGKKEKTYKRTNMHVMKEDFWKVSLFHVEPTRKEASFAKDRVAVGWVKQKIRRLFNSITRAHDLAEYLIKRPIRVVVERGDLI